MDTIEAYGMEDCRKAIMETNDQIVKTVKESNGIVDEQFTKLMERRLMQSLWLQTI